LEGIFIIFLWDWLVFLSQFYTACLYSYMIKGVFMSLEKNISHISREYEALTCLFDLQPDSTRRFFQEQATQVISELEHNKKRVYFDLPEQVCWGNGDMLDILPAWQRQVTGSHLFGSSTLKNRLILHLNKLEQSPHAGLAVSGKLMRFAIVHRLVYDLLPDGNPVSYQPEGDDDIPSIPLVDTPSSQRFDSRHPVKEAGTSVLEQTRVQVALDKTAQRFFIPQWVAFGDDDQLLVPSTLEAEVLISSLQNAIRILQDAEDICLSIVADETYQRKRAGLLGQLVNQGRALARYYTRQIITRIHARVESGGLNRGLQLSLPYFEINDLSLHLYPIDIIPKGRVMFIPEFVVLAMQLTAWKVQQDPQINTSSRRHLLAQLASIESAFNKYLD
jgi:hypothetical protein